MKLSMFQIILLVVFGAFAAVGVLIFALAVGGGASNTVGPVTIWGTLDSTAVTAVIRKAADADSQLNQVTYVQKDPATYEDDLLQALASGTGPDLFLLRQDYAIADAGKVAAISPSSLSQSQFEAAFIDAASTYLSADGILGVPILADPLVLYWNKDMLATGGYASPPRYWDEFYTMAPKLGAKDDSGAITRSAVALGEYQNVDDAKDILATLILQTGNPITAKDGGGHLISVLEPKTGNAGQSSEKALLFYTDFANPSKDYYSWNRSLPDARQDFIAGSLALYIGYASEEAAIALGNPNLNFGVSPLPQIRGAQNSLDTARVYALAAPRSGKNSAAAITAAFLLASSANSQAFSAALGMPSARRDVLNAQANDSNAPGDGALFARMAMIAHSWPDPDPSKTADIFRAMIEDTTSGAALYTEAVQRADQAMSQLLSGQ